MIRLLFNSTRQRGRFALDSTDGHTLSSGQRIALKQGDFWLPGVVESDGDTYAFLPDGTSWIERIPLRAGMAVDDYTTLEDNYPEKPGKEWWEESPEEFVAGFSEETQGHHTIDIQAMQFEAIYGPCARYSEYKRGETVRYRKSATHNATGVILWVVEPYTDKQGKLFQASYVIQDSDVGGFPDVIPQHDILQ